MGAWGVSAFENDDAADWLNELMDAHDGALLRSAFNRIDDRAEYIEAPEASRALAACEIVAVLRGRPAENAPVEAIEWASRHSRMDISEIAPAAMRVIARILSDNSELNELWMENEDDYDRWRASLVSLEARLG